MPSDFVQGKNLGVSQEPKRIVGSHECQVNLNIQHMLSDTDCASRASTERTIITLEQNPS